MEIDTSRFATLPVVNYEALANKDAAEIEKLATAGKTTGMWYLDLRGERTKTFLEDVPALFDISREFFTLPQDCDEKVKAIQWSHERGHEDMERGYHTKIDYHYYEIAVNEYLSGKWSLPSTIAAHQARVDRALATANAITQLLLAQLCAAADVAIPELTADIHRDSDTCFKLVYKPAVHSAGGVVIPWHVDTGILTFLWYDDATTQVPVYKDGKQTEEYETVDFKEGCALLYVSQDLATKSGNRLHGAVHRVVAPPGLKRVKSTMAYMIRPYKD